MAIRNIILEGDELLRKISKPVTEFDERLWTLLDDMKNTLIKADGAGLAGVQVGILKRVFIMSGTIEYVECVNPKILWQSTKCIEADEGCLSVPNNHGKVSRPSKIVLEFYDRFGNRQERTFSDFSAKCACHELDHLEGILYVDKIIKNDKKKSNPNKNKKRG